MCIHLKSSIIVIKSGAQRGKKKSIEVHYAPIKYQHIKLTVQLHFYVLKKRLFPKI